MAKARILIVDDEAAIRFALKDFLAARGYEIDEAGSCREALAAAAAADAIILDHQLPDGTALELLPRVRAGGADAAVLILTGYGSIDLAVQAIKQALEADPPYGASVEFQAQDGQSGWSSPPLAPWLEKAVARASTEAFGKPASYMGEGGTIPFMGMLGEKFPDTQFVITGVLGPHSNAHGPNEFLHIPTGKRVTVAAACLIAEHHGRAKDSLT